MFMAATGVACERVGGDDETRSLSRARECAVS
jgi:hypothetical protein